MGLFNIQSASQALDDLGNPIPFAKRFIFGAGTSALSPIYGDVGLTIMQANPMTADENGVFGLCYLVDGDYKVVIEDAKRRRVLTQDNVAVGSTQALGVVRGFRSVADLLADELLSYDAGVGRVIAAAPALVTVAGGNLTNRIAEPGVTDQEFTTAGGVKLYATSSGGVLPIAALNPAADGATDDFSVIAKAATAAIREKAKLAFDRRTYAFASPLILGNVDVDFGGAKLLYTGASNSTALTLNSTPDREECGWGYENFTLMCTSTDTANRTHGVCLGGALGRLSRARIVGFTGISLGLGSGVEAHTGVTMTGAEQCYYWNIDAQVSSTAGWNLVVRASNNANNFKSFSAFPYDGFAESFPRTRNCINEFVVGGTSNYFERLSLEASPSSEKVLWLSTANANKVDSAYLEQNSGWSPPPFPRITAQEQSSANLMQNIRHPYAGDAINDLGAGNDFRIRPSYFVNGVQQGQPRGSTNLVKNGGFQNKLQNWSDYSANNTIAFENGYPSGKTLVMTLANGRPNILQNIVAVGGYGIDALIGKNITVSAWIKTDLADFRIQQQAVTQGAAIGDGEWRFYQSTVKVPAGATGHSVQMITSSSGLTGYVRVSNLVATIGNDPLAIAPPDFLEGSATYNPPSIPDGAQQSTTVTVPGAGLGDFVIPSFNKTLQGMRLSAYVSATDTVAFVFRNDSGGAIDLGSGTLAGRVLKA